MELLNACYVYVGVLTRYGKATFFWSVCCIWERLLVAGGMLDRPRIDEVGSFLGSARSTAWARVLPTGQSVCQPACVLAAARWRCKSIAGAMRYGGAFGASVDPERP